MTCPMVLMVLQVSEFEEFTRSSRYTPLNLSSRRGEPAKDDKDAIVLIHDPPTGVARGHHIDFASFLVSSGRPVVILSNEISGSWLSSNGEMAVQELSFPPVTTSRVLRTLRQTRGQTSRLRSYSNALTDRFHLQGVSDASLEAISAASGGDLRYSLD